MWFPVAIVFLLLVPDQAYCFGPAFHLKIGYELLNYLTLFSPLTQQLLREFPLDFLYGNISPDIIIGKRFMPYHAHCHNWDIAKNLIDMSRSPRQKAFTYGYLAHLASDVVAHNFFIPVQMVSTFRTRTLTHLYWETRLDSKVEREIWYLAEKFKIEDFSDHEQLLEDVLAFNLFPFRVHKKIYKGYILFSSLDHWHSTLTLIKTFSRHRIAPDVVGEVLDLSVQTSLDALLRRNDDYLYHADPTGKRAIAVAAMIKRNLKSAGRMRSFDGETERAYIEHFTAKFRKAFRRPDELMPIISEV